jgi:hypothetical protein
VLTSQIQAVQVNDDRVMGAKRTRKRDAQSSALIKRLVLEQARATIENGNRVSRAKDSLETCEGSRTH